MVTYVKKVKGRGRVTYSWNLGKVTLKSGPGHPSPPPKKKSSLQRTVLSQNDPSIENPECFYGKLSSVTQTALALKSFLIFV